MKTISVLGTGVFNSYPKKNAPLKEAIIQNGGCIISEYFPYATVSQYNFIQRNRIQAALSTALIPVDWSTKSGTARTVQFCNQQGTPVYGVRSGKWICEGTKTMHRTLNDIFDIPDDYDKLRETINSLGIS